MAIFRCKQSGNTVSFTLQHDIDAMRGHQGYDRVDENENKQEAYNPDATRTDTAFTPPVRRMGRPRKH